MFLDDKGHVWDPAEVSKAWRKVLAEAWMPQDVKLHGLRHTAIDLMTAAGVPDHIMMQIAGHSSRQVLNSYRKQGDIAAQTEGLENYDRLISGEIVS